MSSLACLDLTYFSTLPYNGHDLGGVGVIELKCIGGIHAVASAKTLMRNRKYIRRLLEWTDERFDCTSMPKHLLNMPI